MLRKPTNYEGEMGKSKCEREPIAKRIARTIASTVALLALSAAVVGQRLQEHEHDSDSGTETAKPDECDNGENPP